MIALKSVVYGLILFLLLVRKRSNYQEVVGEIGGLPSLILPLTESSLTISAVLIATAVMIKVMSRNLYPAKNYVVFYVVGILFYNLRVFDQNYLSSSLAGIFISIMIILVAFRDKYEIENSELILNNSLAICFSMFCSVSMLLMIFGYGYHGFRFSGFTFHPNQMGLASSLAALYFMAVLASSERSKKCKIACLFLMTISLVLLISSGSRGAILAAMCGFTYWLMLQKTISFKWLLPVILVALVVMLLPQFSEDYYLIRQRVSYTGDNRTEIWKVMIDGFIQSPLVGLGAEAVGSESSILKALSVGGLICGIPVLILTYKLAAISMNNCLRESKDSVFMPLLIVILVGSLLDGYLFERFGFTTFIVVMLITLSPAANKKRDYVF